MSGEEPLEPPYWTLSKDNSDALSPDKSPEFDPDKEIMGIFGFDFEAIEIGGPEELERQSITQKILLELNERNCFDFRYKPSHADLLTLVFPDKILRFEYTSYGESYIRGYKQHGSWAERKYSLFNDSFQFLDGKVSSISPEKQIRKP